MSSWYQKGQPCSTVSIDDRALHYGDGLFETIAIRKGEPRLWSLHVDRLQAGCARLGIAVTADSELRQELAQALTATNLDTRYALAKIIVSAGSAERGYRRPDKARAELFTGIFESKPPDAANVRDGVATLRCETMVAAQPALAGIKTLNRLEQVLARNEWQDPTIFEGLMCGTDGQLICGTMSNVFLVHDKTVSTPILDRCGVAGVMRRHVTAVLSANGMRVRECELAWDKLISADEVFLSNSQFGVVPVRSCDAQEWSVGPLTRKVMALLAASGVEECAA
jgi:4-amino-4-deoxychorismate lyase